LNGGPPLPSGRYEFTILYTVEDLSINQLDGNHDGTGGDNFSLSFNVNILPPAPVLLSPATKLATNNPTPGFSWQATSQALKYHIQISGKLTFSPIIQEQTLADGVLSYTANHLSDGVYYWRVAGINTFDTQGLWSQTRTFTIDTAPPPAPILKAPADNITVSGTPVFSWISAATATAYKLQYNLTDDFSSLTYSSTWISTTQLTPPWFDGSYYWRVCAKDSVGNTAESSCSTSRSITILPLIPAAPKLKVPAVGVKTSNTPTLSWNATAYGTTYEVQINISSNFTTPEYDLSLGSVLSYTPNNPLASGKYYWRVRAYNDKSVAGAWSSAWYFNVP
jgi:large repetitive protein